MLRDSHYCLNKKEVARDSAYCFSTGYSGKLTGAAPGSPPLEPRVYTEENFKLGKVSPRSTNLYLI